MAAIRQRLFEEKGDWLIYVVDAGQVLLYVYIQVTQRAPLPVR